MPEFAVRKRSPAPALSRRPSLAMHAGQCTICRHPQRAEIERDFLDWRGPRDIAHEYGLGSHTTVYRHAHALGLFDRRHRTLRFALGRLIEQVGDVKPTAASIVSAIRLLAKLNTRQKWIEEADDSQAGETDETDKDGLAMAAQSPVARAILSAQDQVAKPASAAASAAARAEPRQTNGNDAAKNPDEKTDYNGPPIAFARGVGPRRRFFWR